MSDEQKKPRTLADIQNEYGQLCAKLGHARYNVFTIENDIKLILESLRDLNFEAAAIKKAEEEQAGGKAE